MILCMERLHDFCVERLRYLSHSLRLHVFFAEVFLWIGYMIFLLRECMIYCMRRLHDFLCEEVALLFV